MSPWLVAFLFLSSSFGDFLASLNPWMRDASRFAFAPKNLKWRWFGRFKPYRAEGTALGRNFLAPSPLEQRKDKNLNISKVSCDPAWVTFFCYSCPAALPHLKGQLWSRVSNEKCKVRSNASWVAEARSETLRTCIAKCTRPNCILARRSSLGPMPPVGRQMTYYLK